MIFDDELIKYITEQTNLFAMQSDGRELTLLTSEIKTFLGILMKCGIMKPPSDRYAWRNFVNYSVIADVLSCNRFEQIKRFLHFNDNTSQPEKDTPNFDRLFKSDPSWNISEIIVAKSHRKNTRRLMNKLFLLNHA